MKNKFKKNTLLNKDTLIKIINRLEKDYEIPIGGLRGKSRKRRDSEARAIAMFLLSEHSYYTQVEIAKIFNVGHGAVHHAIKKIERVIDFFSETYNEKLSTYILDLEREFIILDYTSIIQR